MKQYNTIEEYLEKLHEDVECLNCFDGLKVNPENAYNTTIRYKYVCPDCNAYYKPVFTRRNKCFECKEEVDILERLMLRKIQKVVRVCSSCYKKFLKNSITLNLQLAFEVDEDIEEWMDEELKRMEEKDYD